MWYGHIYSLVGCIGFEVVYSIVSCFLYFMYDVSLCLTCVHPDTQAGSHLLPHASFITIVPLSMSFLILVPVRVRSLVY